MYMLLVNAGSNLEHIDDRGNQPVHYACEMDPPNHRIIRDLINHGVYLNLRNSSGNLPITYLYKSTYSDAMFLETMRIILNFMDLSRIDDKTLPCIMDHPDFCLRCESIHGHNSCIYDDSDTDDSDGRTETYEYDTDDSDGLTYIYESIDDSTETYDTD